MIIITCGCGKSIAAKPEWAGIGLRCGGCGRSHTLNAAAPPPAAVEAESSLKSCPHCSGRIQPAAIKCRHCGRRVDEGPVEVMAPPGASQPDAGGAGVLVLGILSWLFFCWLPSPIAWAMGSTYEANCRARGVEPSGAGKAGKLLGIIGTILLLFLLGCFLLALVAGSC